MVARDIFPTVCNVKIARKDWNRIKLVCLYSLSIEVRRRRYVLVSASARVLPCIRVKTGDVDLITDHGKMTVPALSVTVSNNME